MLRAFPTAWQSGSGTQQNQPVPEGPQKITPPGSGQPTAWQRAGLRSIGSSTFDSSCTTLPTPARSRKLGVDVTLVLRQLVKHRVRINEREAAKQDGAEELQSWAIIK